MQVEVLIKKFCYFFLLSQEALSADTIPNLAVGIFSPKTERTKAKAVRVLIRWLLHKFRSLDFAHLATLTRILTPSSLYLIDMGNEGRGRDSRHPPPHPPSNLSLTGKPDESQ